MTVHFKESGQTLLEIVMALGVAGVVLGALLTVIFTGLKNTQFSQNQTKATKYAQEVIDQIRSIRDGDGQVINLEGTQCSDSDSRSANASFTFYDLWCNQLSSFSACSGPTSPYYCYFKINKDSSGNLQLNRQDIISSKEAIGDGLSRQILMTDSSGSFGSEKTVIVKVSWTDSSGSHESNIQTILGKR